jgi:hypothetical protein
MMFDTLRLYDHGQLHSMPVPDWYRQAERLSEEGLDPDISRGRCPVGLTI